MPPVISARQIPGAVDPMPADRRALLKVGGHEPLGYRHVRLSCGDTVLSVAHNWYVPGRLTAAMNRELETSQTPFGRVAAPLGYARRRLGEKRGALPGCPRGTVLAHRAVLELADGRPISLVVECYTQANLRG